ncbi:hypothetical protein ACJX0J_014259 [Zea mays]
MDHYNLMILLKIKVFICVLMRLLFGVLGDTGHITNDVILKKNLLNLKRLRRKRLLDFRDMQLLARAHGHGHMHEIGYGPVYPLIWSDEWSSANDKVRNILGFDVPFIGFFFFLKRDKQLSGFFFT